MLSLQNSRNLGSDEDILDLRYTRRMDDRDDKDQEAWDGDTLG